MISSAARPRCRAVSRASRATGWSAVPAATTTTRPPVGAGGSGGQASSPQSAACAASGSSASTAAACAAVARVNSVAAPCSRRAAAISADLLGRSCPGSRRPPGSRGGAHGRGRGPRTRPAPPRARGGQPRPTVTSGRVNAPDWIPARSTATNRKPAATTARCTSSRTARRPRGRLSGRQFDAGDVAVVAHAAVGEPERPQGPLRGLDLGELRRRHRLVVRDPRRQARCRRLVGAGQPEHPRDAPDGGLVEAGVGERPQHVVPGRRLRTGPVGPAHVVGVLAVGDPVEPVPVEHLGADGRRTARPCSGSSGPARWRGTRAGRPRGSRPRRRARRRTGRRRARRRARRRRGWATPRGGRRPAPRPARGPPAPAASRSRPRRRTPRPAGRPRPAARVTRSTAARSAPKLISARIVAPLDGCDGGHRRSRPRPRACLCGGQSAPRPDRMIRP